MFKISQQGCNLYKKNVILLEVAFETLINSKNELLGDIMSRDNFYPLIALYQKIQFLEGFSLQCLEFFRKITDKKSVLILDSLLSLKRKLVWNYFFSCIVKVSVRKSWINYRTIRRNYFYYVYFKSFYVIL